MNVSCQLRSYVREKIICTSLRYPAWRHVQDIDNLQPEYRDEVEHFFKVYKDLEKKKTATDGFGNRAEALVVIEAARLRLKEAGN